MSKRTEIDALKAAFVQATPEGASIPALIQAMLELVDAWQAVAPVAVEQAEAAELEALRAEVKRLQAHLKAYERYVSGQITLAELGAALATYAK